VPKKNASERRREYSRSKESKGRERSTGVKPTDGRKGGGARQEMQGLSITRGWKAGWLSRAYAKRRGGKPRKMRRETHEKRKSILQQNCHKRRFSFPIRETRITTEGNGFSIDWGTRTTARAEDGWKKRGKDGELILKSLQSQQVVEGKKTPNSIFREDQNTRRGSKRSFDQEEK